MKRKKTKILTVIFVAALVLISMTVTASAATVYTVVRGDTMWKIACRYEVGLSELAAANVHIADPSLIYPGDSIYIPSEEGSRDFEREVVRLINEIRADYGLSPLTENWELSRVARYKSRDMSTLGYFSHTSPTYGTPFEMIKSFGLTYRTAGENIARGYKSAEAVVNGWMNSSGHRANILNANFRYIGVGYESNGSYWTQMFIG